MPSYQDIETRLRAVEDKINFTMQIQRVTIGVGSPLGVNRQVVTCSLADLFRQVRHEGGEIVEAQAVADVVPAPACGTANLGGVAPTEV